MFKFIIVVLAGFALWASGLRIHVDQIPKYLNLDALEKYDKLELRDGRTVVGNVTKEEDDRVYINISGATIDFLRSDILKMTELSGQQLRDLGYGDLLIGDQKRGPLITFREEDRIIHYFGDQTNIKPNLTIEEKNQLLFPNSSNPNKTKRMMKARTEQIQEGR